MKHQPSRSKLQDLYQLARMKTGPRMTKNLKTVTAAYAKNATLSRTRMAIF